MHFLVPRYLCESGPKSLWVPVPHLYNEENSMALLHWDAEDKHARAWGVLRDWCGEIARQSVPSWALVAPEGFWRTRRENTRQLTDPSVESQGTRAGGMQGHVPHPTPDLLLGLD